MKIYKNEKKFLFIKNIIDTKNVFFLISIDKISALEISEIRKQLNKNNIKLILVKNKIIKKICEIKKISFNIEDFIYSTAIVWKTNDNIIETSKILTKLEKLNKNFKIKSCYENLIRLDIKKIKILSELLDINTLRKMILNKICLNSNNILNIMNYNKNSIFNILLKKYK